MFKNLSDNLFIILKEIQTARYCYRIPMDEHVTVPASAKHTSTIIFLHGLGDTGDGWASTFASLRPQQSKVFCPTADIIPVTLNGGFRMNSWFDIFSLDAVGPVDEAGIKKARDLIHGFIAEEEKNGIPSNRILLGGFSMGGALALYSAFTYPKPLAGVLAMSCWLPLHNEFLGGFTHNKDIPVLQCHGDIDTIVPLEWGQLTSELLKNSLTNYQFKVYRSMSHSACDEELKDAKEFFTKYLPDN